MPSIPFTISPAPGIADDFIAVIYNSLSPGAEVDRITAPAPHNSPFDFNFVNIPGGIYIVKIHETPGGGVLGFLRHDFWVDATLEKVLAYDPKTFQVGLGRSAPYYDPADQSDTYTNPDLNNLKYTVFKPGYGPLDWDSDITPIAGGGFKFTNNQKFGQDEVYTMLISNLVLQPTTASSLVYPKDILNITANTTFGPSHYNSLLEINTGQSVLEIAINLSSIPDGTQFGINTHRHNGALITVALIITGGNCILNGRAEGTIYINRSEDATFFVKSGELRVVNWNGEYRRVGEKIYSEDAPPTIANILPFTGVWVEKNTYRRLWFWYVARLAPGQIFTGTDDVAPTGADVYKWGVGANKMYVPNYADRVLKVNNNGQSDNEYQADSVGPADVRARVFTGQGIRNNQSHGDGVAALATYGDGGEIRTDGATGTNNNSVRIDAWPIISAIGETRVKSIAVRAYVII
jgi:hypothetical protein